MLHYMKLSPKPFKKIKDGIKTIELRLYDEKRQKVQAGDYIEFSDTDNPKHKIQTIVTALHCFDNFGTLYENLPLLKCGYTPETIQDADPSDMEKFYSKEEQSEYGVVGIELKMTDLQKFLDAQNFGYMFGSDYNTALSEIKNGHKKSHWIWYVFPQIKGLGFSNTTAYFSISGLEEARDYFNHPVLGARLTEISEVLLKLDTDDPMAVFGCPDAYKFRSCMTLFREAVPKEPLFHKLLDKFCNGTPDNKTLDILKEEI